MGEEINSSEVSFEIGRASSGQSVSDTVSRKTQQKAANALKVVANSLQNTAKRLKTPQNAANALNVVANSLQNAGNAAKRRKMQQMRIGESLRGTKYLGV